MAKDSEWKNYFKTEVQSGGAEFLATRSVILSVASDTAVDGYIKGTTARVKLTSQSIGSETFFADCTCSSSARGQLCKHIWAVLALADEKKLDFLDSKRHVEKIHRVNEKNESFKVKQAAYKKQQYEQLKLKDKKLRKAKKTKIESSRRAANQPAELAAALDFFNNNGFHFSMPVDLSELKEAKRALALIFHPDRGGSIEEATALNLHFEVLNSYILR